LPDDEAKGFMDGLTKGQGRADKAGALGTLDMGGDEEKNKVALSAPAPGNAGIVGGAPAQAPYGGGGGNAASRGGGPYKSAPPPPNAAPPARVAAKPMDMDDGFGGQPAPRPAATTAVPATPPPAPPAVAAQDPMANYGAPRDATGSTKDAKKEDQQAQTASGFGAARAAYTQRNFTDATRQFDALAANGDNNAALWAARSVRDGSGCSAATTRYDTVAGRQAGTANGNDALLEGGQCYRQLGQIETARARLVRLLTVASHAARAQRELDAMSPRSQQARPQPQPKAVQQAPQQQAPQQQAAPPKDNAF
jgi:hypothetical protein